MQRRDSYKDHGPLHSSSSLGGYGDGLGGSADESKVGPGWAGEAADRRGGGL